MNEKKEDLEIQYMYREMDFGLRYDLQVKLNKKKLINTLTTTITTKPLSQNVGLIMDS